MKAIPPERYSREYFRFKGGGESGQLHFRAIKYIPHDINGPFLDVGCGKGEIVFYLARSGKRVYGIDYSKEAIRFCQKKLKSERKEVQKLATFKLANCTDLPPKDNVFGCLFLLDIVEHLTPHQLNLALSEAERVLKTRGILIIHTNNKYFEKIIKPFIAATYHGLNVFTGGSKMRAKLLLKPYDDLHVNYLAGPEVIRHLEKIGFKAKVDYVVPKRKEDLNKFLPYGKKWKELVYYNFIWPLLNSPLKRFLAPTFWVIARKQ